MTAKLPLTKSIDTLYDKDYYLWLKNTAQLIREKKFAEVDTVNLIEEIEDMGRSEKRTLESNLVVLLLHLLKYEYQSTAKDFIITLAALIGMILGIYNFLKQRSDDKVKLRVTPKAVTQKFGNNSFKKQ